MLHFWCMYNKPMHMKKLFIICGINTTEPSFTGKLRFLKSWLHSSTYWYVLDMMFYLKTSDLTFLSVVQRSMQLSKITKVFWAGDFQITSSRDAANFRRATFQLFSSSNFYRYSFSTYVWFYFSFVNKTFPKAMEFSCKSNILYTCLG